MNLDGFHLQFLINELHNLLNNAKVNKINMQSLRLLELNLRKEGQNFSLCFDIENGKNYFGLINNSISNYDTALSFCMLLRKYLTGSRLINISNFQNKYFERFFCLNFQKNNEIGELKKYTLLVELMGRQSNLILINENQQIIDCLFHIDANKHRNRDLMPSRPYIPPESNNKILTADYDGLQLSAERKLAIIHSLAERELQIKKIINLDFFINKIAAFPINIAKFFPEFHSLEDFKQIDDILQQYVNLCTCLNNNNKKLPEKKIVYFYQITDKKQNKNKYIISLIDLSSLQTLYTYYADSKYIIKKIACFPNLNTACLSQYNKHMADELQNFLKNGLKQKINKKLDNWQKKLSIYNKDYIESQNFHLYKLYAEMILCQLYKLKNGMSEVSLINYYQEDNSLISIPLNPAYTPNKNADYYFKIYNKDQQRHKISSSLIYLAKSQIIFWEDLSNIIENENSIFNLGLIAWTFKKYHNENINMKKLILVIKEEKNDAEINNEKILTCFDADATEQKKTSNVLTADFKNKHISKNALKKAIKIKNKKRSEIQTEIDDIFDTLSVRHYEDFSPKEREKLMNTPKFWQALSQTLNIKIDILIKKLSLYHLIQQCDFLEKTQDEKLQKSLPLSNNKGLRHYISSQGLDIYLGRNSFQNDKLVQNKKSPEDIWLHTKQISGTHVVIRAKNNQKIDEESIKEAADLCAYYSLHKNHSQIKNAANENIDTGSVLYSERENIAVDVVFLNKVMRIRRAKPGLVYYDEYRSIFAKPCVRVNPLN